MAYPITIEEVKSHLEGFDPLSDDYNEFNDYLTNNIIPTAVEYCTRFIDPQTSFTDASCPYMVKQAMLITCKDLFENRGSYTTGGLNKEDTIQRLLLPYKKLIW